MGVCTALVSKKDKSWFDLGKVFFEESVIKRMRKPNMREEGSSLEQEIFTALQNASFNVPSVHQIAAKDASIIAAWMRAHPDWRFLTDQDEEFDDVYLADDKEEASEYKAEFDDEEEDVQPIYMKSGSL